MNKTTCMVYWTGTNGKTTGSSLCDTLEEGLTLTEQLRKEGMRMIAMACENTGRVGKDGVDEVKNGMTPDGVEYTWVKRRDGGQ